MSIHILGIAGSPRPNGNTDRLLNHALETLKNEGYSTELIKIRDLNYSPCLGCNACTKTGSCIQNDDIEYLQDRLLKADRVIVAAPIFFMGINGQMKSVIDRMQPFWAWKYVLNKPIFPEEKAKPRYGIFLSAGGTKFSNLFDCAEKSVKNLYHVLDIKFMGTCGYRQIDKAGEIEAHPNAFTEVKEKVLSLAKL